MIPGGPTSGTEKENDNDKTEYKYYFNKSYLVEEGTPQILSLGTKPFVIFTDALFKLDAYL